MPRWSVHEALAELCEIPIALMRKLNKFIDSIENPRLHNANRVVAESEWVPEALAYAGHVVLDRWGYESLKAFPHHHILDYAEHLALTWERLLNKAWRSPIEGGLRKATMWLIGTGGSGYGCSRDS